MNKVNANDPSKLGACMMLWLIMLCWLWLQVDRVVFTDGWWAE